MKRITYALFAVMGLVLCACNTDTDIIEDDYIKVVSVDNVYQPAGGEGVIEFKTNSTAAVKAVSNRDWCTVSVQGSKVLMTVGEYSDIVNRYASITISAGTASTRLTIHQYGRYIAFEGLNDFYRIGDEACEMTFPIVHGNYSPEVKSSADWLEASIADNVLTVKVSENNSGMMRKGVLSVGDMSITFDQWEFDNVFGGKRLWCGTKSYTNKEELTPMEVMLTNYDEESSTFDLILGEGIVYPDIYFDLKTLSFTIGTGLCMGTYVYKDAETYVYPCVCYTKLSTGGGYVTYAASPVYADFFYEFDEESSSYIAYLKSMDRYEGNVTTGVRFELFKAQEPVTANRLKVTFGSATYNTYIKKAAE